MNGEVRRLNNTLDTINAAASAIASAGNRLPPSSSVQKRKWGSRLSLYWCFGFNRQRKRIGHAILLPETTAGAVAPAPQTSFQAPSIVLPFIAPPSSPASFLQSEPPSAIQSPVGLVSLSANMYSPSGPSSIFAIGPYAHETQLVSPPVFSTFTTEPSTPFTPPPESLQLTTPSSPEVPFARFLGPNHQTEGSSQKFLFSHYEFQSYQLYPGSPVGQLISPSSGISGSGTSSPLPDRDFDPGHFNFLEFHTRNSAKLLNLEKMPPHERRSQQGSGSLTPDPVVPRSRNGFVLDRQNSDISPLTNAFSGRRHSEAANSHRVSFEITAEQVVRCVEKKPAPLPKAVSASAEYTCIPKGDDNSPELGNDHKCRTIFNYDTTHGKASGDIEDEQRYRSISLGNSKEFNFDNADGGSSDKEASSVVSNWWAENVTRNEVVPSKNWSFFPAIQPGVS